MKKLTFLISLAAFIFFVSPHAVKAQEACAPITSVSISTPEIESGKLFNCDVIVGDGFGGSRDIACGLSFNGAWPQDFCPSDVAFGAWQGNHARFNCVFPNTNLPKDITSVNLVAFDFRPSCGMGTGKSIPVNFKKLTDEQLTQQPPQRPEEQVNGLDTLLESLLLPFGAGTSTGSSGGNVGTGDNPDGSTPTPTTTESETGVPTPTPNDNIPHQNTSFTSLRAVLDHIGGKVGVPPKILEAIAYLEYTTTFTLPSSVIESATTPGNVMPNCPINECSAAGPMQMTIGVDDRGDPSCSHCCWLGSCSNSCPNAWGVYGRAASQYENTPDYTPLACNIRDNIYGAALKLKTDAQAASPSTWTRAEVNRAGYHYFGDCSVPIREGKTYCDFMWWYYNQL